MEIELKSSLPKLIKVGDFFYCSNCNEHVTSKTTGYRHVKVCMEQCPPSKTLISDERILEDLNNSINKSDEDGGVGAGAYQCIACNKGFKSRHSLYKHEKYCGIAYSFAPDKEDVEEELLNCKNCDESFESIELLERHEKRCVMDLFICNICSESFDSINDLCRHEISHIVKEKKTESKAEDEVKVETNETDKTNEETTKNGDSLSPSHEQANSPKTDIIENGNHNGDNENGVMSEMNDMTNGNHVVVNENGFHKSTNGLADSNDQDFEDVRNCTNGSNGINGTHGYHSRSNILNGSRQEFIVLDSEQKGVNGLLFEKMEMNGNRHPSPPPVNGKIHIPSHMMGNIVGMNGSTKRSFIDLNHTSVIDKKKIDDPYNLLGTVGGIKEEMEEQYTVLVIDENDRPNYDEEIKRLANYESNGVHQNLLSDLMGNTYDEYQCQYCDKGLKSKYALEKHEIKCQLDHERRFTPKLVQENGKLYCGRCGLHVTSKTTGYRHEKICSQREADTLKKLSECSSQSVVTTTNETTKSTKGGQDVGVYHCNICQRNFSYGQSFQKHVKFCGTTNHVSKKMKENAKYEIMLQKQQQQQHLLPLTKQLQLVSQQNPLQSPPSFKQTFQQLSPEKHQRISEAHRPLPVVHHPHPEKHHQPQLPPEKKMKTEDLREPLPAIKIPLEHSEGVNGNDTVVVLGNEFMNDSDEYDEEITPAYNHINGYNDNGSKPNISVTITTDEYKCKFCQKSCNGRIAMNKHQQRCKFNTDTKEDRERERSLPKLCREGDKFYCARCGAHVTSKTTGYRHVKMCANNPIYDEKKKAPSPTKVIEEIPAEAGTISINEDGTYNCNICLRSFTYRQSFTKHIKVCGANQSFRRPRGISREDMLMLKDDIMKEDNMKEDIQINDDMIIEDDDMMMKSVGEDMMINEIDDRVTMVS